MDARRQKLIPKNPTGSKIHPHSPPYTDRYDYDTISVLGRLFGRLRQLSDFSQKGRRPMKLASVVTPSLIVFGALASVACGGSSSSDGQKPGPVTANAEPSCNLHTSFAGDDRCILPPGDGEGLQLHIGPPDYDNPDPEWIMQPGQEMTQCYHTYTTNEESVFYFKQQYRMRPGSHHMIIINSTDTTGPEQWGPCGASIVNAIGGTQHVVEDYPPGGKLAPEDAGLAKEIPPHSAFDVQLHFYNSTPEPTLREVWVNLLNIKKNATSADVQTNLGMLGGFAPVRVPPHGTLTTGTMCNFENSFPTQNPDEIRVVSLFGHAHTHNKRFAVYHQYADQTEDLVYDSYDGAEAPQYVYSTAVENPVADPVGKHSGATSGQLIVHRGEALRFECDIVNDLNITLNDQNEVFTAEMCNLFGSVAGLGFPCFALKQ